MLDEYSHLRVESQDGLLIAAHEKEGWQVTTQSLQPCHVVRRLDDVFPRHGQRHDHQVGLFGMFQQILPQSKMPVGLILNGEKFCFSNFCCEQKSFINFFSSSLNIVCYQIVSWVVSRGFDAKLIFCSCF